MNPKFKKSLMDLMQIDGEIFDKIYSEDCFRGIRINPQKCNFNAVQNFFDFELIKTPFYKDEYYIPSDFEGIGNTPLHHAGAFYVQEPSASSVVSVIAPKKGEKILDLCAAPGGKSTAVGAELSESGILWSNEYVRKRAAALLSNIERMGIGNCAVSSLDAEYLCSCLEGYFDCVLVDAPCSGEGMWRHNPLVEKEWSLENIELCSKRQKEILSSAVKAVKSGGRLVYSTCTFNKKENEENVVWFLEQFPMFSLEKIDLDFGMGGLSGEKELDQKVKRIFPTQGGEGHFIALFKRAEDQNFFFGETVTESISKADKQIAEAFLKENFAEIPQGVFVQKNSLVYLVPEYMPLVKGDVLRYGLFVGEIRNNRLEPSHALFSAMGKTSKNKLLLSSGDERAKNFLKGMEIFSKDTPNGYTAILIDGAPLGFGKCSGGRITNKYPKGLRIY